MTAESDLPPLTDEQRQELRALVFDTNAFPWGGVNVEILDKWSKLCATANLELWIPEPVLWEWAEHAARSWQDATTAAANARRALRAAGLDVPGSPYRSREMVIETVEAAVRNIGGTLKILPLTGAAAVAAIQDQIMQRPPGRTKKDIKTGASDSSWLRLLLQQTNRNMKQILIVGQDADVSAAFKEWNVAEPRQVPLQKLEQLLFILDRAEDAAIRDLVEFINKATPSEIEAPLDERKLVIGRTPGLMEKLARIDGIQFGDAISDASIARIENLLGLSDVQVDRAHSTVSARVFFLAEVEYLKWQTGDDERSPGQAVRAGGFLVSDRLTFKWVNGSVVRGLTDDDNAYAVNIDPYYYDPSNALYDLIDTLDCTPGFDFTNELEQGLVPDHWTYQANGRAITLEKSRRDDDGWEFRITVRHGAETSSILLTCQFDASANPTGEPDMFPAWVVSTSPTSRFSSLGAWDAARWLTERVWG